MQSKLYTDHLRKCISQHCEPINGNIIGILSYSITSLVNNFTVSLTIEFSKGQSSQVTQYKIDITILLCIQKCVSRNIAAFFAGHIDKTNRLYFDIMSPMHMESGWFRFDPFFALRGLPRIHVRAESIRLEWIRNMPIVSILIVGRSFDLSSQCHEQFN